MPCDITDFIFYTFFPIFEKEPENNWGNSFINKIYWTHVAKRSLKNQKKDNAIKQCIPLLKEELEAIQPNLIIVATHYFWKHFGKYKLYSTIEAIQNEKKSLLFSTEIINGLSLNNAMIAVFPNPSPTNYKHKVDFYKKGYVADLIEKIHNEIEKNYTNLP